MKVLFYHSYLRVSYSYYISISIFLFNPKIKEKKDLTFSLLEKLVQFVCWFCSNGYCTWLTRQTTLTKH